MKELEVIGISSLLIISAIFYVVRKRMILYQVLCASVIAALERKSDSTNSRSAEVSLMQALTEVI